MLFIVVDADGQSVVGFDSIRSEKVSVFLYGLGYSFVCWYVCTVESD